jgi:hypothetical protein
VTEPVLTMNVTVAKPPCVLEIVAVQVPPLTGVTMSLNIWPVPVGGPNETIAVGPLPHDGALTEIVETATVVVTVTICAYAPPTPENVRLVGAALTWPGGTAVPVKNGGGFAAPP